MTAVCSGGIGGKRLFERNGRDTRGIVSDFIRALNDDEYRIYGSVNHSALADPCFFKPLLPISMITMVEAPYATDPE
jgi:hypothetical protein